MIAEWRTVFNGQGLAYCVRESEEAAAFWMPYVIDLRDGEVLLDTIGWPILREIGEEGVGSGQIKERMVEERGER